METSALHMMHTKISVHNAMIQFCWVFYDSEDSGYTILTSYTNESPAMLFRFIKQQAYATNLVQAQC